jgi:hypothetical protein
VAERVTRLHSSGGKAKRRETEIMKKPLFVSALVLGASMFVAAQQAPPASTPPTFPSDSTQQQTPAQQRPDAMPDQTAPTATPQSTAPDTSAPASQSSSSSQTSSQSDQGSSSSGKAQSIEGCVSQDTGMAGGYVLTDNSGTKYTLAGDTSKLSSFVGQEVKVKGSVAAAGAASSSATADQSSSSASSTSGAAPAGGASSASAQQQLTVQNVKKVADTCSNAAPAK